MEKPKAIFKEPAVGYLFGGTMLLAAFLIGLVHFFSEIETKPGEVPTIVVVVMLVVIAVIVMIAGRCYTVVDENGVLWGSDFGKKQIVWTDVEKVGIEWRRQGKYGFKCGTIVLIIAGKKSTLPYTRSCMQCVRAYYGEPDYDLWNQAPDR